VPVIHNSGVQDLQATYWNLEIPEGQKPNQTGEPSTWAYRDLVWERGTNG